MDKNVDIKAGEPFSKSYAVTGDTTFKVKFTPDKNYAISAYEKLSSYDSAAIEKKVSLRTLGANGIIVVTPDAAQLTMAPVRKTQLTFRPR